MNLDNIGDQIQKNYLEWLEENKENIPTWFKDCPKQDELEEDEEYDTYIYIKVHKDTLSIDLSAITSSQYWTGESQTEYWVANQLVFGDTTYKNLKELDVSEESHYYDIDDDDVILNLRDYYIPIENILTVQLSTVGAVISFEPRSLFAETTTITISKECLKSLKDLLKEHKKQIITSTIG